MAENKKTRLHAVVKGRVQGVGFRYFVEDNAARLGLSGWVRNLWDGSVEVTAEGERQDLEKLLKALQRGPVSARVTGVHSDWRDATGEFSGFHVKLTSG